MKHYPDGDWVDLARGVCGAEREAEMRQHLESGCPECNEAARIWRSLAAAAVQEREYTPDERSVRMVKGVFSIYRPRRSRVAQLLLDTLHAAPQPGLRSDAAAPRQMAYQSGECVVDIRLEQVAPGQVQVTGQVMDPADPYGVSYAPVLVRRGEERLVSRCSNRFGEFQFELPVDSGDCTLVIGLPDASAVEIPLEIGSKDAGRQ